MKYLIVLLSLVLVSCGSFELNNKSIEEAYTATNKTLNLENKGLTDFVNLNGLSGSGEVADIMIYDNEIQVLNVSEYIDL